MMIHTLTYPFTAEQVRALKIGDSVMLSGKLFTGRDRLHKYLAEGGACPVSLTDGAIFHCGPVVTHGLRGWHVHAAGPTTSIREEPYMSDIIRALGVRVIIGKGGMGARTRQACRTFGCVYLHAVGGAAQVLADKIERVDAVYFRDEFGMAEAMWELTVKDFPTIVTIDSNGDSLHERVAVRSERKVKKVLTLY